ncbi:hypothetical protein MHM84_20525 [Halomonas sp. McH1-25]|uniref:hypothetical protein n=1 Tax=unclassified Halomonas TaxID=2609666 RepID=UPI001EF60DFA|nr:MULTISPECIES: hypothetical protein [unclassified Halomonas]MCG7602125.1 hypothetical protein [Halomonas sp. McH1-25]MCP1344418.1 hypothetical protein [Halomonas sp. FL8]MCP1362492.1 hypothetical protein [Halomonas sp. BBD45]
MFYELEQRFDRVVETSQQLIEVYRNNMGAAWALHSPTPNEAWLRQVLLDFWYVDEQDGRATRTYVGLLAANEAVLSAVAATISHGCVDNVSFCPASYKQ